MDTRWEPLSMPGEHPAFLQATSGSTGVPKCVIVTHRSLLANKLAISEVFSSGPEDISYIMPPAKGLAIAQNGSANPF